jgi:hypothetical protein
LFRYSKNVLLFDVRAALSASHDVNLPRYEWHEGETSSSGDVVPDASIAQDGPVLVVIRCPTKTVPLPSKANCPPVTLKSIRPVDVPAAIVEKSIRGAPGSLTTAAELWK